MSDINTPEITETTPATVTPEEVTETAVEAAPAKTPASNIIVLFRGSDELEVIRTFRASGTTKSPKRAFTRFINLVLGDPTHELHVEAVNRELHWTSSHLKPVGGESKLVASFS